MENKIVSPEEFGVRLETARSEAGLTIASLLETVGIDRSTWNRWVNAESEGGCFEVARTSLALGKSPNALLLAKPIDAKQLTPADAMGIENIRDILMKMTQLCRNSPQRPVAIVEDMLRRTLDAMEFQATTIPSGTVIEAPEKGVKTYQAPRAGEDPPVYGKAKRRKK